MGPETRPKRVHHSKPPQEPTVRSSLTVLCWCVEMGGDCVEKAVTSHRGCERQGSREETCGGSGFKRQSEDRRLAQAAYEVTERCRVPPPTYDHPETRCSCKPVGAPRDGDCRARMEKARRGAPWWHPRPETQMRMVLYDPTTTHARRGAVATAGARAALSRRRGSVKWSGGATRWTAQNETDRWTAPYACHRRSPTVVTARTHWEGAANLT